MLVHTGYKICVQRFEKIAHKLPQTNWMCFIDAFWNRAQACGSHRLSFTSGGAHNRRKQTVVETIDHC